MTGRPSHADPGCGHPAFRVHRIGSSGLLDEDGLNVPSYVGCIPHLATPTQVQAASFRWQWVTLTCDPAIEERRRNYRRDWAFGASDS